MQKRFVEYEKSIKSSFNFLILIKILVWFIHYYIVPQWAFKGLLQNFSLKYQFFNFAIYGQCC